MTNKLTKALDFCRRRGIPYTVQEIRYGFQRVEICAESYSEYEAIASSARKLRGIETETHFHTRTIWLYPSETLAEIRRRGNAVHTLTEIFWQAIHAGKDQQTAREEQTAYAQAHGLTEALAEIYT